MKRIAVFLFALLICVSVAANGGASECSNVPQELPGEPVTGLTVQSPETEGFREEDYNRIESTAEDGTRVVEYYTKDEPPRRVRFYCEYPWGDISDDYYNPDGIKRYSYWGNADGTGAGFYYDEAGMEIKSVHDYPDGEHGERLYYKNGNQKSYIAQNAVTGANKEIDYYENGMMKSSVFSDPSVPSRNETAYYENGQMMLFKTEEKNLVLEQYFDESGYKTYYYQVTDGVTTVYEYYAKEAIKYYMEEWPDSIVEQKYDEDGYRIYYRNVAPEISVEMIADENGKLIRFILDGNVVTDPKELDSLAKQYNFRR